MNAPQPTTSGWRYFPFAIIGALAFVIIVNAAMITTAVQGFPGKTGRNGFDLSNQYNAVLERADHAAALGWQAEASLRNSHPVLRVLDSNAAPLANAQVTAEARRPVGPEHNGSFAFTTTGDGTHVATAALGAPGQWDLLITVHANGQTWQTSKRLFLP